MSLEKMLIGELFSKAKTLQASNIEILTKYF